MVTDHQHGGYNMDDNEIGVIISLVAVVQLFFQVWWRQRCGFWLLNVMQSPSSFCLRFASKLIVYSRIVKLFGYRWTFRLFVILYAMACIFLPFSNAITGPIDSNDSNITTGGSGSGWNDLWAGSGVNSTDYCGLDTSGFEGAVNENSIRRLPPLVWTVVIGAFMTLVLSRLSPWFNMHE